MSYGDPKRTLFDDINPYLSQIPDYWANQVIKVRERIDLDPASAWFEAARLVDVSRVFAAGKPSGVAMKQVDAFVKVVTHVEQMAKERFFRG